MKKIKKALPIIICCLAAIAIQLNIMQIIFVDTIHTRYTNHYKGMFQYDELIITERYKAPFLDFGPESSGSWKIYFFKFNRQKILDGIKSGVEKILELEATDHPDIIQSYSVEGDSKELHITVNCYEGSKGLNYIKREPYEYDGLHQELDSRSSIYKTFAHGNGSYVLNSDIIVNYVPAEATE